MRRRLELLDTSILVELLEVPFESDNVQDVTAQFEARLTGGIQLHLPVASVVESGDHIGRIDDGHDRRRCAERFDSMLRKTLAGLPLGASVQ